MGRQKYALLEIPLANLDPEAIHPVLLICAPLSKISAANPLRTGFFQGVLIMHGRACEMMLQERYIEWDEIEMVQTNTPLPEDL